MTYHSPYLNQDVSPIEGGKFNVYIVEHHVFWDEETIKRCGCNIPAENSVIVLAHTSEEAICFVNDFYLINSKNRIMSIDKVSLMQKSDIYWQKWKDRRNEETYIYQFLCIYDRLKARKGKNDA